jgi:DNA-binding MarR family transcriptional regulator
MAADGRRARQLITAEIAAELERIAVGSVDLTTRALARANAGFELTFPQWRTLVMVGEQPDGLRIGEIAARIEVTVPATGRLVRRLERRELVGLTGDERDRRATRVRLTIRGREVREAILGHRRRALGAIVDSLPEPIGLDLPSGLREIATLFERFA